MNLDRPLAPCSVLEAVGGLEPLRAEFRAALRAADLQRARRLVDDAAESGLPSGRLYVEVVRPALAELHQSPRSVRTGLAAGIAQTILTDLVRRLPPAAHPGCGRAAVLSCRAHGIEAVDGSVATDFLASDGWAIERLHTDEERGVVDGRTRDRDIELAVAVTSGPEDALRLASLCTELRRLADPPVILLCDFSGRSRHLEAASALGADAVVHDPEELIHCAAHRTPTEGRRRWGVQLRRAGDTLRIAPTGRLDAGSVRRLADVVLTRVGTFSRLELELRDLAAIAPGGIEELARWPSMLAAGEVELVLLAGPLARRAVADAGGAAGWKLSEPPVS